MRISPTPISILGVTASPRNIAAKKVARMGLIKKANDAVKGLVSSMAIKYEA